MLPLVGNQRTDCSAACAESTVPNEFADGGPQAENARLSRRTRASNKLYKPSPRTKSYWKRSAGRLQERPRARLYHWPAEPAGPGSELERRPDREDNTENELAQFLEEGLRDGLSSQTKNSNQVTYWTI